MYPTPTNMNTLIINGHPRTSSFSHKAMQAYTDGLKKTKKPFKIIDLQALQFDPNLSAGYKGNILEADLVMAQEAILWADHIVWIYPTWWWSVPALLKGFIDRVLVPDFAFKYEKGNPFAKKLLKGKTSTLIVTMDGPSWYYKIWMRNTGNFTMKTGVLGFCGIKTLKTIVVDNYGTLSDKQKEKWLLKIEKWASTSH